MKRKIVWVEPGSSNDHIVYCDDGTVWAFNTWYKSGWERCPSLPQPNSDIKPSELTPNELKEIEEDQ